MKEYFISYLVMAESLEQIFTSASQGSTCALSQLLGYGREKGFENFINRKLIWPFLLGINTEELGNSIYEWEGQLDKNSSDYEQLQKDAERALANMKIFENITKFHLQKKQRDVLKILDSFFSKNRELRYIQGFHDVASIFLILFGNNSGYYMMEQAGKSYFKDFLTKDIGQLGVTISELVLAILFKADEDFKLIFECFAEMKLLMFIIPWILTWFSHVFSSAKMICRIWDYLLCTGPHGIIYLTAGVILATKEDLVNSCSEYDHASIHTFYQEMVKKEAVDIEKAIAISIHLEKSARLPSLPPFASFETDSVFLSSNFELLIDIHRRAKEYDNKVEVERSKTIRNVLVAGTVLAIAGFAYIRYGKRLH